MHLKDTSAALDASDPRSEEFIDRLSAALSARGLLDELASLRARKAQIQTGERFDLVLTRLGLVPDARLAEVLSNLLALPLVGADDMPQTPLIADILEPTFLKANRLIPIEATTDRVVIATADPFNTEAIAALRFLLDREIEVRIAAAGDIDQQIERLYDPDNQRDDGGHLLPPGQRDDSSEDDVRRLQDMASEAPVIRLVHDIVVRAVAVNASDVHVEPRADSLCVRYRIDGVLHTMEILPLSLKAALVSRIKIMAQLNIAERRLPQDGRIKINVRGRDIDLRVSTMPTISGESVVLRILDRASIALDFEALGFRGDLLAAFRHSLAEPNGILLVTGPTGSGKTTTLYTALEVLNSSERKLFTVEDPIEYQLTGVNQIQVSPRIGLTFASALRSILRQDPDVIMVGEIRDLETAEIAVRASLTGHLVLSTVHTNNAAASVTRLFDMGVEDYLLASSLKAVIAQRLVRRLCAACSEPADLPPAYLAKIVRMAHGDQDGQMVEDSLTKRPVGCPACRQTGYSGRTSICELLIVTDSIRDAMLTERNDRSLEAVAVKGGMVTMLQNGLSKVFVGETTLEEVLRVTRTGHAALYL